MLGQFLHGVGAAPLITLGTTFLDENVSARSSPLYISMFQTWFVIGPAVGYVAGGQLLAYHTDFVEDSGLSPQSSLWVGAWWPGFLIGGGMSLVCSLAIFCFPPKLDAAGLHLDRERRKDKLATLPWVELAGFLRSLLSNTTYLCVCAGQALDGFAVSGLSAFLPKVLEQLFSLSGGHAAMLVGLLLVPGGGGGTFLGGWIIKRLCLNRTRILLMCAISQLLTLVPLGTAMFLYCDNLHYVGVNSGHTQPFRSSLLVGPERNDEDLVRSVEVAADLVRSVEVATDPGHCSRDCGCDERHLDPVCGSDGLMYLSPCTAGCSRVLSRTNYTDCSCLDQDNGYVTRTKCPLECGNLIPYSVLQFFVILFTFLASMPGVVATLRSVHPEERSLALGLQSIISRLIGSIPGPVTFGIIVDKYCLYWEKGCDTVGSCLLYDNRSLSLSLGGLCLGLKALSVLFYSLAVLASQRSAIPDHMKTRGDQNNQDTAEPVQK